MRKNLCVICNTVEPLKRTNAMEEVIKAWITARLVGVLMMWSKIVKHVVLSVLMENEVFHP